MSSKEHKILISPLTTKLKTHEAKSDRITKRITQLTIIVRNFNNYYK